MPLLTGRKPFFIRCAPPPPILVNYTYTIQGLRHPWDGHHGHGDHGHGEGHGEEHH